MSNNKQKGLKMVVPKVNKNYYDSRLQGIYGLFGSGGGRTISYIQGHLSAGSINSVSLVSDIKGSEKWPIRELFQREIDEDSVNNFIVPYLKDPKRVKFFNPLTFLLLPKENGKISQDMPSIEHHNIDEEGFKKRIGIEGCFRLKHDDDAGYAELEWSKQHAEVVAIDGQHRLAALRKNIKSIETWNIPIVILMIIPDDKKRGQINVIESARQLFIDINKEAHQPNETREIILDERGINEVCTQEVLEASHSGKNKIPLFMYDWRGIEENMIRVGSINDYVIFDVPEVRDWLAVYIFGENSSTRAEILGVSPTNQNIYGFLKDAPASKYSGKKSDRKQNYPGESVTNEIRSRFCEKVLGGFSYFIENFSPYKSVIDHFHTVEKRHLGPGATDIEKYAFDHIKYGGEVSPSIHGVTKADNILKKMGEIKTELAGYSEIPYLLTREIGHRGVFFAFGDLFIKTTLSHKKSFKEYSTEVTAAFNQVWNGKNGICELLSCEDASHKLLLHIVYDNGGSIVNYRIGQAKSALGALIALIVSTKFNFPENTREEYQDTIKDAIEQTLIKGFRRQVKAEKIQGGRKVDKDEVDKEARTLAKKQIKKIINAYLG